MTNLVISGNVSVDGANIEQVYSYKYLGHEITIGRDNQTHEIQRRVGLTWAAFGKLRYVLKSDLPMCLKRKVFHQCVMPVLTYGAETLTLTKKSIEKIRVAQRAMERAMLGVSLRDKIPSTVIKQHPCLYILRFASKLEFGNKTQMVTNTALRLVQRMKRDSIHSGRRPSGLCGAALLIASRLHEFSRSIGDIVKVVKVHESTMRKRLMEFGDTPSSALSLEEFMTVDLEEEQDPPCFKAARKKDKERLQKLLEDEAETVTDLQKQIDVELEQSNKKYKGSDRKCGPDIASIGLPASLDDTSNAPQPDSKGITFDLNFDDVDDEELDSYIMSDSEFQVKHELWHELNAEYLKKQKEKEEQLKKEREEGKPEKKRKRHSKRQTIGPSNSAGEAIEKIIQEKKISTKINYEVLKSLKSGAVLNETSDVTSTSTEDNPDAKRLKSTPVIIDSPPKKQGKSRKIVDVGLPFLEDTPAVVSKKKDRKETVTEESSKNDKIPAVEEEEAEEDADDYYEEEQPQDDTANEMGVLTMLNQHHQEMGEDQYGYDDDGYEDDY
ncbi:transcription factor IIIB 90 kDa subunit-like [Sitophilus oryzae]|uniref:Transcription factor IIIB 90 kDa subunit-like n=1 Tax=Sitophilus oryzae TaxID=7048 RepID=A0A6J2X984_SITOR|nr:transcription factor IIIB 90 kDa subunit-like [Sitophilus oryzae]